MQHRTRNLFLFAILFLLGVPGLVHRTFGMHYYYSDGITKVARGFWTQFPISLTVPYLLLALLFLLHSAFLKDESLKISYCGAIAAWLCMMFLGISLIFRIDSTKIGPTSASIDVALTPFLFIPFLVLPYFFGAIGGMCWNRKAKGEGDKPEYEARQ